MPPQTRVNTPHICPSSQAIEAAADARGDGKLIENKKQIQPFEKLHGEKPGPSALAKQMRRAAKF